MLGKLLKYEFKSTARTFFPLYLVLLGFALLSRFSLAGMEDIRMSQNEFLSVFFVIAIFGYVLVIFSVVMITFLVIVQRFYKNMTGDEGYLMHTLPVSTHKLIQAKIISGAVWEFATIFMIFLSLFVLLFQPWFLKDLGEMMQQISFAFGELAAQMGSMRLVLFALEFLLLTVVGTVGSILMIYAAIAIGHTFKTHRILGGVVAYMGLNMISQVVSGIVGVVVALPNANMIYPSMEGVMDMMNGAMGLGIILTAGFAVTWYFVTHYVLTSQLNLE